MRLREHIRIAVIAGAVTELVLIAPLFLASYPLPCWIAALGQLQAPGASLVLRLLHTELVRQFVAHGNAPAVLTAGRISIILIQAILLSLVAFGAIFLLRSRVARRILARRGSVLLVAFVPPSVLLLLAGALVFPYLIAPDWAEVLASIAYVWLVLAAIFVGIPLAVARFRTANTT